MQKYIWGISLIAGGLIMLGGVTILLLILAVVGMFTQRTEK